MNDGKDEHLDAYDEILLNEQKIFMILVII